MGICNTLRLHVGVLAFISLLFKVHMHLMMIHDRWLDTQECSIMQNSQFVI
jgi:hypothetical protein